MLNNSTAIDANLSSDQAETGRQWKHQKTKSPQPKSSTTRFTLQSQWSLSFTFTDDSSCNVAKVCPEGDMANRTSCGPSCRLGSLSPRTMLASLTSSERIVFL